ncbi:unnamed protein product [Rhizoctonia solani]|uniref:Uncharacterized protein n=1 Tax=Rhizoctonia solani TaxID=456999 RepID=A0A8H2XD11_9AGAM|nr:unnamed protein product [Rhizoctonia solani]
MSRGAITVNLPRENPFGEAPPNRTGGRSGNQQTGRRTQRRYQSDDNDNFDDQDQGYNARQTDVVQLPTVNPFGREEPSRANRQGGQSGGRQAPRRQARRSDDEFADEFASNREGDVVQLSHSNPFAVGGPRPPQIVQSVYPPDDEPEPEEDFEEEEPAPRVRRAQTMGARPSVRTNDLGLPAPNQRQRQANSRSQRPSAAAPEDDRLVISWVDEALVSPPRSPAHRHGHNHSSATSESESYFALRPNRPRSVRSTSPGHAHRSNSHHRDQHSHHHHHHGHHDRHCHQCNHLVIPPWQAPYPMPPPDWSGYGAPRSPYSPAPPYAYPRPLYANIPHLPSLLDQVRVPYPPVPVEPVAFIRALQAQAGTQSPTLTLPEWKNQLLSVPLKPEPFLTKLQQQEFSPAQVDRVFRKLTTVVQVRFGERQGNEIVNRVHLVPRGRLAMGTVLSNDPKLDIDFVIPSDFILRRWNVTAAETDPLRPQTVADALDLTPASINRGEVEMAKLHWVFQAVWEQLNGSADGSIFPGGRDEAERYLPLNWCTRYKDEVATLNRLALNTVGGVPIKVNLFVKVSLSMNGQDMIVGVDQLSMRNDTSYQLIKTLRTPGVSLSEPTLSPTLHTAILILCYCQQVVEILPGKIRTSHFHLALTALRNLEPTDEIFSPAEPFSLALALKAVLKILTFLGRAYLYTPPTLGVGYAFPLSSCTIMDTLRFQGVPDLVRKGVMITSLGFALAPFQVLQGALSLGSGDLGAMLSAANKVAELADKATDLAGKATDLADKATDLGNKATEVLDGPTPPKTETEVSKPPTEAPPPQTPVSKNPAEKVKSPVGNGPSQTSAPGSNRAGSATPGGGGGGNGVAKQPRRG